MKNWTEVSPYSGIEEDAPANNNNASSGAVDMNPDGGKKKKLLNRSLIDARTKAYREHKTRLETRRAKREELKNKSKFIEKVKEAAVSEIAYGSGYDVASPVAEIQPVYAAKSSTGYELYHKDFSGAMQHAYKFAKSKGVTVDPKEIDSKVATGPKKPSSGKTNKYILGTNKKNTQVHIQVANLDNKRYELNMYID
jgi:FtsZ-interacting cell division protein YlmF